MGASEPTFLAAPDASSSRRRRQFEANRHERLHQATRDGAWTVHACASRGHRDPFARRHAGRQRVGDLVLVDEFGGDALHFRRRAESRGRRTLSSRLQHHGCGKRVNCTGEHRPTTYRTAPLWRNASNASSAPKAGRASLLPRMTTMAVRYPSRRMPRATPTIVSMRRTRDGPKVTTLFPRRASPSRRESTSCV